MTSPGPAPYEALTDLGVLHIHILIAPSLDVVPAFHLNPGPIPPGFYTRRAFHIYPALKTLFPAFFAFSRIFARKREINALLTLVVVTGGGAGLKSRKV